MYVIRSLVLGKCWRCGRKIFRYDEYYVCSKCNTIYCPICTKKTFSKCPCDGTSLEIR